MATEIINEQPGRCKYGQVRFLTLDTAARRKGQAVAVRIGTHRFLIPARRDGSDQIPARRDGTD